MQRTIDKDLKDWSTSPHRKPLIVHGARQVGKTFSIRKLGQSFTSFIEVNFERAPHLKALFAENSDLDAKRILRDLSVALQKQIIPGETLLFLDEIQEAPRAIIALRYLYEEVPDLHVIAAGSLIQFAIEQVGVPVGRVEYLYMYPLSWLEFLQATGHEVLLEDLSKRTINEPMHETLHTHVNKILRTYLAIGGMPEVVQCWKNTNSPIVCQEIHQSIIQSYRQDFNKYARRAQIKYVEVIFERAITQIGKKFQFKNLATDFRKRELEPALELLEKASILHRVWHSSGQGVPLGAQINYDIYKIIFLDIGLMQTLLRLNLADWFLDDSMALINKRGVIEAFVGQEFLAYANPRISTKLFYWLREGDNKRGNAEIDYLIQKQRSVIPIEVKSTKGTGLKSVHMFLESHPESKYCIRYSMRNYSEHNNVKSYPLYAIAFSLQQEI